MNMRYIFLFCFVINIAGYSQALRDINYKFLYDPSEPFEFDTKAVRLTDGWKVFFDLSLHDTTQQADQYIVRWDIRASLGDKEGIAVDLAAINSTVSKQKLEGTLTLALSEAPQILAAKVLNNYLKRAWLIFIILDPNYPLNGYLTSAGKVVQKPYVKNGSSTVVEGEGETAIISFYDDDFPAAVPPFSEAMAKVAQGMRIDTSYSVPTGQETSFNKKGLYLVQKDTGDARGFAFRVEEDYPRYAKVESLADPLIYVCTKQEFDRIKAAEGDKKAFDRIILGITGSPERAKNFMRNYFRRVEWANYYFTSYKEGWKTDRGMIYILFGEPDELYKFTDREVWKFNSGGVKATFNFVKSSTVFDPENYVLIREKKFQDTWYEKIDLWRNARF